jgi:glutamate carboxypeptidase
MKDLLTERVTAHLPEALDSLRRMVMTNSFTTNAPGVARNADLTAECFAALRFDAEKVAAAHPLHGPHLFLRRGNGHGKPVVLVTHLDTVFPPEEEDRNGFRWREESGRIHGPGTVDNKGGTILIWLMLRAMQDALPELFEKTHWLIAANAAEEVIGSDFARKTELRCPDGARCVLVFEGGPHENARHHLVTSRKGRAEFRIHCSGRAAHAGSSFSEGLNAVVELAKLLPRVHELNDPARHLTVNISRVEGGTVFNRVPHEAMAELEMRAFDPAVLADAESALHALCGTTTAGALLAAEKIGSTPAWPGGEETDRLFSVWREAAAVCGISLQPMARGGLSDANYLSHLGPTLDGLGPVGGSAHCSEWSADGTKVPEFVDTDSFVWKAVGNLLALQQFG